MSFSDSLFDEIDPDQNYFSQLFSNSNFSNDTNYYTQEEFLNTLTIDPKSLTIINFNIRSFIANSDAFLSGFENQTMPEIFVFTETWFNSNNVRSLNGYNDYHTFREQGRSGGVSIYAKNTFSSRLVSELSYSNTSIEISTVEIVRDAEVSFVIGIYRPHSDSIQNFDRELAGILSNPLLKNKTCMVMGDLNINLLKNDYETRAFINNLTAKHFMPTINKPTRFSPNSVNASTLDHIWINKPTAYESGIILNDLTDHCPTFIKIPTLTTTNSTEKVKVSFRQINDTESMQNFKMKLCNFDWDTIKSDNVNDYFNYFSRTLNSLFCSCFPLKIKYVTRKSFINPWVTSRIRKLINLKSNFFKFYKMNIVSKETNNKIKNKIHKIIEKSKIIYYKNLFYRHKNNVSKTWNVIREILGPGTVRRSCTKLISNDREITNNSEIAEIFNDYFSQIATALDSSLPNSPIDPLTYVKPNLTASLHLTPTTADECSDLISELKLTKTDKDSLPVSLLKNNKDILSPILSKIINLCFKYSTFPNTLKYGSIVPILKSNSPFVKENYRPIIILLMLSKIFERAIYNRSLSFFMKFSLLSAQQFGFQKGLSTESAIINLLEYIYETINSREITLSICIDFRKAFDTVNHKILLNKLEKYGIRGPALALFQNYLQFRTQSVKISNHISSSNPMTIGIPQGSCLGPLLFLIYVNDIPNISNITHPILYADDATLCLRGNSIESLISQADVEMTKFSDWSIANRLTINLDKTFTMNFTTKRLPDALPQITVNNTNISSHNTGKFLGVTLDSKLTFSVHIDHVCKKVAKSAGILYKLQKYLPTQSLINLYYTFIYPHLLYCNIAWGSAAQTNLEQLFILQKKCIRTINKAPYNSHTNRFFHSNKILKLTDINKLKIACYMYSNPTTIYDATHNYNTRYRDNLTPHFQRTRLTQRSLTYSAPTLWNQIPAEIKASQNLNIFKQRCKEYFVSLYDSVSL